MMTFRGRDFLAIVRLLEEDATEASIRTQIGHLYYAAFHETRRFCETKLGYSRTKLAREHRALRNLMLSVDQEVAEAFAELRTARNAADYDDMLTIEEMRAALEDVRLSAPFVIRRLDQLR